MDQTAPTKSQRLGQALRRVHRHHASRPLLLLIIAMAAVIVVAGGGAVAYRTNTPINATFMGQHLTADDWRRLDDRMTAQLQQTSLTVIAQDSRATFAATDLGISYDLAATNAFISHQEALRKRTVRGLLQAYDYHPLIKINADKLSAVLEEKGLLEDRPVDAQVRRDGQNFTVVPGRAGWKTDVASLQAETVAAITRQTYSVLVHLRLQAAQPQVSQASAEQAKAAAEVLVNKNFMASYDGGSLVPSRSDIASWVVFSLNHDHYDVSLDGATVKKTVDELASNIASAKRDKLVYKTPSGNELVADEGSDGLAVTNAEAIASAWSSGQTVAVANVSVQSRGIKYQSIADQYIDIDMTAMHLTVVSDGGVIKTFPISAGKPGFETPTGSYQIYAKTRVQTMSGCYNGECWSTPNIQWVSWFEPNIAMHGAYWHNDFGKINRSKGCVNLRDADAEWIYENMPIGTTVVAHW